MRDYELVFIVHPDLEENAFNDVIENVRNWITDNGGQIVKTDIWGKRELAYPIRKVNQGQYVLMETQLDPNSVVEIERNLRFLEPVLRYLFVAK